jgi:uncharacterized protein (TIGR00730 family)
MEAANRGAKDAGGRSVGCNIRLKHEQRPNPYLDRHVLMNHFFVRKVLLFKYSFAFVILPGGFGTMDECFEALTLIQTGKIQDFPLVVMDNAYWRNLQELLGDMLKAGTINPGDLRLLYYADSVDEAIHKVATAIRRFGFFRRPAASRIFGETGWNRPRPAGNSRLAKSTTPNERSYTISGPTRSAFPPGWRLR